MTTRLLGFGGDEEAMVANALQALAAAGYETDQFEELVRAELPPSYRAMTLDGGAALGAEAFASQALLTHVLEEELLHLRQKLGGRAVEFQAGTARMLEEEIDVERRFPAPDGA